MASLKSGQRQPRRAAYALPTLFTAGNIFLGFVSVMRSLQGAILASTGGAGAAQHFEVAAKTIGLAVLLDGLDGRIARLTNTTSEFGREMDSLADVISFGIAPAVLAYCWGVQGLEAGMGPKVHTHLLEAGRLIAFLFLLCGSARLARFNVQKNPVPRNPGRPDRKYFAGLPIPAAAALVAAVVYGADSIPVVFWPFSAAWLGLLALLSFLMVSTWRYRSFKDLSLLRPWPPLVIILLGSVIYLVWNWAQPVLLAAASAYVASGILTRIGGMIRRRLRHPPRPAPEHQVG